MDTAANERQVAIPWRAAAALEGIFLAGAPEPPAAALIAPPHPLYGGSLDSPVVTELAHASRRAGLASLRFNWRGVGASAGEPSGEVADADADYETALQHLAATVAAPLVACGYSFGAAAALRVGACARRVRRLVLVSPPPPLVDPAKLAAFGGRVLLVTGEDDALAPPPVLEELARAARDARFASIPGADHFFGAGLGLLGRTTAEWLQERAGS